MFEKKNCIANLKAASLTDDIDLDDRYGVLTYYSFVY